MSATTPAQPPTAAEVRDALHWWHETYGSGFSPHRALVDLMAARSALVEAERRGAEKALRASDPVTAFLYDRADAIARGES